MFGRETYLIFELVWAAPVIAIQWIAGPRCLWASRRLLLLAIGAATLYLSLADAFALNCGIWSISPGRVVALGIGPLPIEEVIFFGLTNCMVVQSIVLLRSSEPRQRLKHLFAHGL